MDLPRHPVYNPLRSEQNQRKTDFSFRVLAGILFLVDLDWHTEKAKGMLCGGGVLHNVASRWRRNSSDRSKGCSWVVPPVRYFPLGLLSLPLIAWNRYVECNSPDVTNALHQARNKLNGNVNVSSLAVQLRRRGPVLKISTNEFYTEISSQKYILC